MKLKNITLVIVLTLSHCLIFAQRKPKIKGNRSVTEVVQELPPFSAIELNDDLEIFLQKGISEGYTVTADDNLVDILKFKVVDSTLIISSFYKIIAKKKLDITVNYRELEGITVRDGKIGVKETVVSDQLFVNTFGTSKIDLNAAASIMSVTMEEGSSGVFNLDSDSLNINLKNKANAYIYSVGEKSTLELDKNTSVTFDGTTDSLQVKMSGNANLKAENMEAAVVSAKLEDAAFAKVYAYKSFELSAMGSTRVHLYGDPRVIIQQFLGTSALLKKEDK
ncbi:GIN domain-containing protein [Spongiimicrobium sp. 3-5]|uniref:GIN domain-containing protein n=1 Tax=Spongiimicrobium sp. 3-5 TaxID=3332596 RepID=UPI003981875B